MFNGKVFLALSLPLTASGYSIVLNVLRGSSFLSLPISLVIFGVFILATIIAFLYICENEEKKVVSDHISSLS